MIVGFASDPINTLAPAFAQELGRPDTDAGLLIGVFGAGAVLAALVMTGRVAAVAPPARRDARPSSACRRRALRARARRSSSRCVILVVAGFAYLTGNSGTTSRLQLEVADEHRGRIMALWAVAFLGLRPVASLLDGALASAFGVRVAGVVLALPALAAGLALLTPRDPPPREAAGMTPIPTTGEGPAPSTVLGMVRQEEAVEPALEVALSEALLLRVARGSCRRRCGVYRPRPTVAFGRLDKLQRRLRRRGRGGARARLRAGAALARRARRGVRRGDGRVRPRAAGGAHRRGRAGPLRATLGRDRATRCVALGVDARVGEVPGEYCRGAYSVNAGGRTKLVGTAQRAIRGGALLAGFVTVEGADRLRDVLVPVYAALELDVGSRDGR